MIGLLKGHWQPGAGDHGLILIGGVGYEVTCSQNTQGDFLTDSEVEALIHTHVREDQFQLYAFSTAVEKKLFSSLIKVNGIGPKLAVTILSAAKVSDIVNLIEASDAKGLSKLPRIGKKTAEQMILSLKGQLVMEERAEEPGAKRTSVSQVKSEAVSALVNLGFRLNDVEQVVEGLDEGLNLQDSIRKGLSLLTN